MNETIRKSRSLADTLVDAKIIGGKADRVLEPLELSIVAALHLNPRASWGLLARALKTSESTVARYAQQMLTNGELVVVGTLERPWDKRFAASMRVKCRAGMANSVAKDLADEANVRFVGVMSPTVCVIETVTQDQQSMLALLDEQLPRIEGIVDMSCDLLLKTFTGANAWDPKILPPEVARQLIEEPAREPNKDGHSFNDQDMAIVTALCANGRMSVADLSRATTLSQSTARRRVQTLIRHGILQFRTIVEPKLLGYGIELAFWLTVEPSRMLQAATKLAAHPTIRYLVATTGRHTLFGTAVMHDTDEVFPFVTDVLGGTPNLQCLEVHPLLLVSKRHWNRVR